MGGHELAMALRTAYLAMHRRTNAVMAPRGVTADQFVVLAALSEGDALTQRELVERTASDPNTLRAMLVLLERRGLTERRPHPTDGRARSVSLTAEGRRMLRRLWRESETVRDELLAGMSPEEIQALVDALSRVASSLSGEPADRASSN